MENIFNPEEARAYAELHQALCEYLQTNKPAQVSSIPSGLIHHVGVHLATCSEGHEPIAGLETTLD